MIKEIQTKFVKKVFNEDEKKKIATRMAKAVSERSLVIDEKKASMSGFKSRLDALDAQINQDADSLNNGYEFADVQCEIEMNHKDEMVRYWRVDTGELAGERPMTPEELQMKLPLEDGQTEPEAVTDKGKKPENLAPKAGKKGGKK